MNAARFVHLLDYRLWLLNHKPVAAVEIVVQPNAIGSAHVNQANLDIFLLIITARIPKIDAKRLCCPAARQRRLYPIAR